MKTLAKLSSLTLLPFAMLACGDDSMEVPDEELEVISRVTATLTPMGGGTAVEAVWDDPDGDGGMAPTIGPMMLAADMTYTMTLKIENALETPAEDITVEVQEEAEDHQLFFTVTEANLTVAYADMESTYVMNMGDDLPVGLRSTVVTTAASSGTLQIQLNHQPMLKSATSDINTGEIDFSINFPVTIQ